MFASRLPLVLLLGFVAVGAAATEVQAQRSQSRDITLTVGEQTSIPAQNVAKYSEGIQGVVDVRLPDDGTEFIIVGLKPGVTTLLLVFDDGSKATYQFTVVPLGSEVGESENIQLDFYFVELSNSSNYSVGVTWPTSIGIGAALDVQVDLQAGSLVSATAGIAGHPLPRLDMLEAAGWARVSRHATLVTANGKPAVFNSGGEFNVAVNGSISAEVRSIPFGSAVSVLPRYDKETGRIEVKVSAEFSSLNDTGASVPGRSLSKVDSVVNVELNQAVVLAGLNSESENWGRRGLPLLSRIPILGYLFGSRNNRTERVQNVVFIVPSVVDVVSLDGRRRIDEAVKVFDEYSGDSSAIGELKKHSGQRL